jgi:hypothetical protein
VSGEIDVSALLLELDVEVINVVDVCVTVGVEVINVVDTSVTTDVVSDDGDGSVTGIVKIIFLSPVLTDNVVVGTIVSVIVVVVVLQGKVEIKEIVFVNILNCVTVDIKKVVEINDIVSVTVSVVVTV